jgi:hypothetical protein
MRVAVIVVLMLVRATPSEASTSCMTKTEARQHFGSVYIYWHGPEHCWDATPTRRRHQIHKVQQKIMRSLLNIFDGVVGAGNYWEKIQDAMEMAESDHPEARNFF